MKLGNITYSSKGVIEISKSIREMMLALENMSEISRIIDGIGMGDYANLRIKSLQMSKGFLKYFPTMEPLVNNLNANLTDFKNTSSKAKKKTKEILSKRTDSINKIINKFGIPYRIYANYRRGEITEYKLTHVDDNMEEDRKKSLSNGEKNIITLILFLLDVEKKDVDLVLLDDPISSMDEFRRILVSKLITDKLKGKTVLVLSHDDVFAKAAVMSKEKNVGLVSYFKNNRGDVELVNIEKKDYGRFDDF